MMRLFIELFTPLMSLYLDVQVEEFETLTPCILDEGFSFHLILGWKLMAGIAILYSSVPVCDAVFSFHLLFFQTGRELFRGKNILHFMECRLLPCNNSYGFNCLKKKTISFSLIPLDLSSRKNFWFIPLNFTIPLLRYLFQNQKIYARRQPFSLKKEV